MSGLILLASYPKSGNTWLRLVLDSALRGGAPADINSAPFDSAAARTTIDRMLGLDSTDLREADLAQMRPGLWASAARKDDRPLVLKVHDAWLETPVGPRPFEAESVGAVLHVVRDPRDVAVSFAHHMGIPIDEAINAMADETYSLSAEPDRRRQNLPQYLSSWSRHAESWMDSGLPLAMTRYEDLLREPLETFSRIFRRAGLEVSGEALSLAVEGARFETLQTQERAAGFVENRPGATAPFFRRGEAGGWRDTLTAEQVLRIESHHGPMMRRLGYLD